MQVIDIELLPTTIADHPFEILTIAFVGVLYLILVNVFFQS